MSALLADFGASTLPFCLKIEVLCHRRVAYGTNDASHSLGQASLGQSTHSRGPRRSNAKGSPAAARLGAIRRSREQDGRPPSSPIPLTVSRSARSSDSALPSQMGQSEIATHNTICDHPVSYTHLTLPTKRIV